MTVARPPSSGDDSARSARVALRLAAAFVALGAFLLFSMEPLIARLFLPSFGSAFHVWSTSLMFFQAALFVGYLYAQRLAPRLGRGHLLVLALPLAFVPFAVPDEVATPSVGALLLALTRTIAVPFAVLAATSVVAQDWVARASKLPPDARTSPWWLYAASNAGSLAALLLYVFAIEPRVGLRAQSIAWAAAYLGWLLLGVATWRALAPRPPERAHAAPRLAPRRVLLWVLLAAGPSALSLAVTNVFVLDVGNAPLVWIPPLVAYLVSFVLVFGRRPWRPRWLTRLWPHVALVGVVAFVRIGGVEGWLVVVHLAVLFLVATAVHGELFDARPEPSQLGAYYLAMALGGWLGSAFVALAAPAWLVRLDEYPLALASCLLTVGVARRAWRAPRASQLAFALVALVALVAIVFPRHRDDAAILATRRSAYGIHTVTEGREAGARLRVLKSGRIIHGRQRLEGDALAPEPISYFHTEGPLGEVLRALPRPRRVGVIGLGVGALVGHLDRDDAVVFHEIDPAVAELARAHFGYLASGPEVTIVLGDARHGLERERREGAPRYDLVVVDAFSGDAVPVHLLTTEAMALYRDRSTTGRVLYHVSNRYFDLRPPLAGAARRLGLVATVRDRARDLAPLEDPSRYVLVEPAGDRLWPPSARWPALEGSAEDALSDDLASLLRLWSW